MLSSRRIDNPVATGFRSFTGHFPNIGKARFDYTWIHRCEGKDLTLYKNRSVTGSYTPREVSTLFGVNSVNFLRTSKYGNALRSQGGSVYFPSMIGNLYCYHFRDARLLSITISATPDIKAQNISGDYALGFMPQYYESPSFYNDEPPSYDMIMRWPGSVCSGETNNLELTFKPKIHDGYVFNFLPLSKTFGSIGLVYRPLQYQGYQNYKTLSVRLQATATFELGTPFPNSYVVQSTSEILKEHIIYDEVWDYFDSACLALYQYGVYSGDSTYLRPYVLLSNENFTSINDNSIFANGYKIISAYYLDK